MLTSDESMGRTDQLAKLQKVRDLMPLYFSLKSMQQSIRFWKGIKIKRESSYSLIANQP